MSRHCGDKPLTQKQQKAAADKAREAQNERKEAQRLRDSAMGIERIEVRFSARTLSMVRFGCQVRGGLQDPYGLNEYLDTLVRQDYERLRCRSRRWRARPVSSATNPCRRAVVASILAMPPVGSSTVRYRCCCDWSQSNGFSEMQKYLKNTKRFDRAGRFPYLLF